MKREKELAQDKKFLIQGINPDGRQFRPGDWAERISNHLSTFKDGRIQYSKYLQPVIQDGYKCVLLDRSLKTSNPELYRKVLDFARNNHLNICDDHITDD